MDEEDMPVEEGAGRKKTNQEDLVIEAKSFFSFNKEDLGESIRKRSNVIIVDFMKLTEFSNKLSDEVLVDPEETLRILELGVEELGLVKNARVRLKNIPESHLIKIRNIRSKHLNELIVVEGIIRQASDVRPQVVNAKFECPSCGTIISVLQIEKKFREPSRCSCGRRGGFRLASKEMVDTQRLVIEESPESLTGGEQPKRINVFVKEDLVEPKMEEKTTPGAKVKVIGVLKEVPVPLSTGGLSTRFELAVEVNNLIPLEETFEELDISDEDERQILELSQDPKIFENLSKSISPSVWGYEEIKKSLVLQLFGGVKKEISGGAKSRGDIHILLIGDPGVAKSIGPRERVLYNCGKEMGYEEIQEIFKKYGKHPKNLHVLTINQEDQRPEWAIADEIIKHAPEKELIKVTTSHGKSIVATKDHSFITLKDGNIVPIKGEKVDEKTYLPIPLGYHKEVLKTLNIKNFKTNRTNSKEIPEDISLNEISGFFFGIFLSEGYIRSGKSISISNKNKRIQSKVKEFGKDIGLESKSNENEVVINSTSFSNVLKTLCYNEKEKENNKIKGNFSRIKKIPDFAFFAPRDFIKGLISGLFSGDGRFVKDKTKIKGFELLTVSKKLAEGTSDLLFSIGILNKVNNSSYIYKNKKTGFWKVFIPAQSIKKFRKSFNFYGREFLKHSPPIYSYGNLIPCGELVYELTKKMGYNSRKDGDRTFASEMRTVKKRGVIGRLRLRKIIKKFEKKTKDKIPELEKLKKLAYSPIIWSKVDKIEKVKKEKEVYDLSIPRTNTFVSNGIGVHNSVTLGFMANISPKGRYVVGKSASGAGLCVSPESVIMTENGELYKIKDKLEESSDFKKEYNKEIRYDDENINFKVQSMSENMSLQEKTPSKIWKIKSPEEIYEIKTISGKKIELTGNTSLFVKDKKWKKAMELKIGEKIAVSSGVITSGKDKYFIDLIDSNPKVIGFEDNLRKIIRKIGEGELTKREICKKLRIAESNLYYNWVREDKKGCINLNKLKELSKEACYDYRDKINYVSLYNGKKHRIPVKINKEFMYLTGLISGDGDLRQGENKTISIRFSNSNLELQDIFRKIIKKEFELGYDIQKGNEKRPEATRFNSKVVGEVIQKMGVPLSPKSNKIYLSNVLLSLKNELVSEYIAGLYDSDGSVFIRKGKGSHCIELTTTSEKLARGLQYTLLRYNINSSIRKRSPSEGRIKGKYDKWIVEIRQNYSIKEFSKKIKLRHPEKSRKLAELSGIIKNEKNEKINFEKIKEIKKIKSPYPYVYDLTIDKTHNFLVNGIMVHNTATVVRDEYLKGWSLEAGAMVLAHKGLVCIDELEKMDPQDRSAMHEAMEQQSVTISKANVQASLKAETSVLAAANPKFGRFDPYQSIAQQIDLPPTLINRFDIIFTLRDIPNRNKDEKIATHVLSEHRNEAKEMLIDPILFRKYIAYSKQRIKPVLSDDATEELKRFYVELRNTPVTSESAMRPIPISARQLQALVRMAEARAKIRLSETVSKEDARESIEIMKYYLMQVGYDYESNTYDIDKATSRFSSSQRNKILLVKETITALESKMGKMIPYDEIEKELEGRLTKDEIEEYLNRLLKDNEIYRPKKGYIGVF